MCVCVCVCVCVCDVFTAQLSPPSCNHIECVVFWFVGFSFLFSESVALRNNCLACLMKYNIGLFFELTDN